MFRFKGNALSGFARVPHEVVRDSRLSGTAKLAFLVLASFANRNYLCFPSQATVCELMGCSVRTLRRAVRELEDAGHMTTQSRGQHQSCSYNLDPFDTQKVGTRPAMGDRSEVPDRPNETRQTGQMRHPDRSPQHHEVASDELEEEKYAARKPPLPSDDPPVGEEQTRINARKVLQMIALKRVSL